MSMSKINYKRPTLWMGLATIDGDYDRFRIIFPNGACVWRALAPGIENYPIIFRSPGWGAEDIYTRVPAQGRVPWYGNRPCWDLYAFGLMKDKIKIMKYYDKINSIETVFLGYL